VIALGDPEQIAAYAARAMQAAVWNISKTKVELDR